VALIIGVLAFLYNIRVRRLLEVERLRTRIASDLHDEVGSSLTKITTNAGLAVYAKSIDAIKPKLEKIETSAREVVSMMNDIIWSIDSRMDTTRDLLDRMRHFAFNLLEDKNIEIDFKIDEFEQKKKISVDIRQNLFLIFKEAINNAAKYSETNHILVHIRNNKAGFKLKIIDNGKGLPDKISYGNGLRNMKMRAERIQANLEFRNENGLTIILTRKEL
jgi:signal transduction histidine kinase